MRVSEAPRPTGTVTFLFTDVQGSTTLWDRHPKSMPQAAARHDDIVRTAIQNRLGYVFSTGGDGFAATFPKPSDAIRAAIDAQRQLQAETWPDGLDLRVRIGVHVGAAEERDGDYFGTAVNRAARVMSLAHGKQVVVSLAVEELVRDELRDEAGFVALGEYGLRGMARGESLFQLTAPGLAHEFPPIASRRGNLPPAATSFVGRVEEVAALARGLSTRRLVTLVGPGGVGKTRLSIEAAAKVADTFPDGVWLVELAPLADKEAVPHAVASTLSIFPEAGLTMVDSIVAGLAQRRMLIILDNCEHVIDAAAAIAAAIERGAPLVKILASSREPLGVTGEWVYLVQPLEPREAVDLFVERAEAASSAFVVRDTERRALVELVTRLDGIPLAVELAAGRMRSMSIAELGSRLHDRFQVLRANRRRDTADDRQITLLGTVEWSYRLLQPDERLLFDRLSVFAGSFDVAAVEAICADEGIDEFAVIDVLDGLVDRPWCKPSLQKGALDSGCWKRCGITGRNTCCAPISTSRLQAGTSTTT